MRILAYKIIGKAENLYYSIRSSTGMLASVVTLLLVFLIIPDIVARYFNIPIQGISELSESLMIAIVFFGLAWTQSQGKNVRVDFFASRLPQKAQKCLEIIGIALAFLLVLGISVYGAKEAYVSILNNEAKYAVIRFPLWPARILLAFGSFLLCIEFIVELVHKVRS